MGTLTGHKKAFAAWFSTSETERRRLKIAFCRRVPGIPPPPPDPDEVRRIIFNSIASIGERRAAQLCDVHRTTVSRWLDGSTQIPGPSYALLLFHAEGIPPGCGDAWRGFCFGADTITTPDGRLTLTASEIAGLAHILAYQSALESKIDALNAKIAHLEKLGDFGSANDALISTW